MKKKETIRRYGIEEYERRLKHHRRWSDAHPKEEKANHMKSDSQRNQKGGKYYERMLIVNRTGLRGKRNKIRNKHRSRYYPYKRIIAPESQLHHQWIPETADFRGVALVEADSHMQGYIDVIQILEGEITLFTESEIRGS